jgi:hypothetical protein
MTSRVGNGGTRTACRLPRFDRTAPSGRSDLERPVEVVPGITVGWDPVHPRRCGDVDLPDDAEVRTRAGADHLPWLRLAAVTVLDRLLYLPLDRSLLDAELAAARLVAARTLDDDEPVRELLVRRALVGARSASRGVVAYLERLGDHGRRPPPVLTAALTPLIDCYAALAGEVRGLDAALGAVLGSWRRLCALERATTRGRATIAPPVTTVPAVGGAAQIDPRWVPARVLRFGPRPDTAEIGVDPVQTGTGPAVRVRVAAFSTATARDEVADVGVRLVDRGSGAVHGYGLLGRPADARFEGLVPLPTPLAVSDVRVEVFDVAGDPPPLDGCDVTRVRRATLFLSDWRALAADVRLWGERVGPAARLGAIVRRLSDDHVDGADLDLWSCGPSNSRVARLVELDDRTLGARLRSGRGVVAAASGPGDLLAAEVAAAYDRSSER